MSYFKASTLVFIDPTVQDYQHLISGLEHDAAAIVLDRNQDGIEQITNAIRQRGQIESIHLVSHGEAGTVYLGSACLNGETLRRYAQRLQTWSNHLTADAEILLYGCRVAAKAAGKALVRQLSQLTGAAVAASTQLTGSAALGGNWEFEVQIGNVKSGAIFSNAARANYAYTLAPDAIPNLLYTINNGKIFFTSIETGGTVTPTSLTTGNIIPNTLAFNTFAIARDPLSPNQLIYYVSSSSNRLGSWDPITGDAVDLGAITGATLQGTARMAFRNNGQLYVLRGNQLYTISTGTNLGAGNSASVGTASLVATISGLPAGNSGDMAFDPANPDILYITGSETSGLYKVTFTGATPSAATLVGTMVSSSPGLAFGPDGNLYGSSSKNLIRINTSDASTTLVAAVGTDISDFATLPILSPDVDLSVSITDSRTTATTGDAITYTITVTNTSGYNVRGVSVRSSFTNSNLSGTPNWSAANASGVSFPTAADQTGSGNLNAKVNLAAGASVTYTVTGLTVSGSPGNIILTTVTVSPPEGLTDIATNPGPNTATDTTSIPGADTTPPIVTVNSRITADNTPDLTGTVDDPAARVFVTVNGTTYEATNQGDGTWFLAGSNITSPLPNAVYDVTAEAIDTAGNKGIDSTNRELTIDTQAPVVTVDGPKVTSDTTPDLTGNVNDPTAKVFVSVNGVTYEATNKGDGTWFLAGTELTPLPNGIYDIKAEAVDPAGNQGFDATANELIIDTKAPVVTVNPRITNDTTPELTGTVDDPTAKVEVTVNGKTYLARNNGNGTWTLADNEIKEALADGLYDVSVSATDQANNIGRDSSKDELTIKTQAPAVLLTTVDLTTGEDGSTGEFQVVLSSRPTANVILSFTSSDTSEGIPTITTITFTPGNWNLPQTVTIKGQDDTSVDGNVPYTIQTSVSSADSSYNGITVPAVTLTNFDNDAPGITITPTAGLITSEAGQTATFTAVLNSRPTSDVIINLTSSDPTEGTVPTSIRFTPENWNLPQTVTITGVDDNLLDGNISYTILTSVLGDDPNYSQIDPADLLVTNLDNEIPKSVTPDNPIPNPGGTPLPPSSLPPVARDVAIPLVPGSSTNISGLFATDPDGEISAYVISSLPPADQGILFLGDPANGGVPITIGQKLTPDQINRLVFQSSGSFSGASFTYTAIDSSGTLALIPATVALSVNLAQLVCQPGTSLKGTRRKDGLQGTAGSDRMRGLRGNDVLNGRGCNDVIHGGRGRDRLFGEDGHDWLKGGVHQDRLRGWKGNDRLDGGRGKDGLFGGPDQDRLRGRQHRDRLNGNEGDDQLDGGLGWDQLRGGAGNDIARGKRGNDRLRGGSGDDWLIGNRGRDRLWGGRGEDRLHGGLQSDRLSGNQGNDTLRSGRGQDWLSGRQGNDRLYGGRHRDTLKGHQGRDILHGGRGRDRLLGGANDDVLVGGGGPDTLLGGSGRDRFVYHSLSHRGDRILDFDPSEDVIDISRLVTERSGANSQFKDVIKLTQVGSHTAVKLNLQEGGAQPVLAILENVNANMVGRQNFLW
ncbi:MAG: DUF4347 domain-containing protein [Elainella sp. C42_A2020_010]|nr:DUF4347 domain-containing protein [Elainella sp. C42_A2020_010]